MQGFGDENAARHREVGFACDQGRTGEVSGCADTFEHGRERDEAQDIRVGEGVGAGGIGSNTGGGKSGAEGLNVDFFVVRDVLQVVVAGELGQHTPLHITKTAQKRTH